MDPLFPELPEDLTVLSDDELAGLLQEHEVAAELIDKDDEDFTKGFGPDELLEQYAAGVEQIEAIRSEQQARIDAQAEYTARKNELAERRKGADESEEEKSEEEDSEEVAAEGSEELAADASEDNPEGEDEDEDGAKIVPVELEEPVVASGVEKSAAVRLRRPPQPTADRMPNGETGTVLVAAAGVEGARPGVTLDRETLASSIIKTAARWGRVAKHEGGSEQRILIASAHYHFPEERRLHASDWAYNSKKISGVVPGYIPGVNGLATGSQALVASGGLCAPLEPIYSMPNFASQARPVRDALPSFQADRGGVNVPTATYIADITTAISLISVEEDALGGTFATKSCQDLDCPAYTEVAVAVLAHCREYGNLNSMAWPEKIAHENELTMAAHARTAETFLLDRIKALSINVTTTKVLGAYADLVRYLVTAAAGIRYRLRMDRSARFQALAPAFLLDILAADTASTPFDRFKAQNELANELERYGISISWTLDVATGAEAFAAEVAGALDPLPNAVQIALYPAGEFIHIDSGSLELGIVRDSTLNSTNDHQLFGESFENVARLGPEQGALWITADVCPTGEFPSAHAALTCS